MTTEAPLDRDQAFLRPPDLKDQLPEDDLAHFSVGAAERVRLGAFRTDPQAGGKRQYDPRLRLAVLVYRYAKGCSRRGASSGPLVATSERAVSRPKGRSAKKAASDARKGRRGRPPKPPAQAARRDPAAGSADQPRPAPRITSAG